MRKRPTRLRWRRPGAPPGPGAKGGGRPPAFTGAGPRAWDRGPPPAGSPRRRQAPEGVPAPGSRGPEFRRGAGAGPGGTAVLAGTSGMGNRPGRSGSASTPPARWWRRPDRGWRRGAPACGPRPRGRGRWRRWGGGPGWRSPAGVRQGGSGAGWGAPPAPGVEGDDSPVRAPAGGHRRLLQRVYCRQRAAPGREVGQVEARESAPRSGAQRRREARPGPRPGGAPRGEDEAPPVRRPGEGGERAGGGRCGRGSEGGEGGGGGGARSRSAT